MTSLSWSLLIHVVALDTWIRLVVPPAINPVVGLAVLAAVVVLALIATKAGHRAMRLSNLSIHGQTPASARPTLAPEPKPRLNLRLASGHGSRAPGRRHRLAV